MSDRVILIKAETTNIERLSVYVGLTWCIINLFFIQDLKSLMERLQVADSERNLLHRKLFGADASSSESGHTASMADVLHKVESLFQERDSLVGC